MFHKCHKYVSLCKQDTNNAKFALILNVVDISFSPLTEKNQITIKDNAKLIETLLSGGMSDKK